MQKALRHHELHANTHTGLHRIHVHVHDTHYQKKSNTNGYRAIILISQFYNSNQFYIITTSNMRYYDSRLQHIPKEK